jgi:hypothetical protein
MGDKRHTLVRETGKRYRKTKTKLGSRGNTWNLSPEEAEAGGSQTHGQSELQGRSCLKTKTKQARHQWFMPIILATQEAEIRRITV